MAKKGEISGQDFLKAKDAMGKALEECWEKFEHAIHETASSETAGVTISVRFKPEKVGKKKSVPPRLDVFGKMNLPSNKASFTARDSGGQLSLTNWYGESE